MISHGDMHLSFQHMHCKGFVADRLKCQNMVLISTWYSHLWPVAQNLHAWAYSLSNPCKPMHLSHSTPSPHTPKAPTSLLVELHTLQAFSSSDPRDVLLGLGLDTVQAIVEA